jgi:hypothetical protein
VSAFKGTRPKSSPGERVQGDTPQEQPTLARSRGHAPRAAHISVGGESLAIHDIYCNHAYHARPSLRIGGSYANDCRAREGCDSIAAVAALAVGGRCIGAGTGSVPWRQWRQWRQRRSRRSRRGSYRGVGAESVPWRQWRSGAVAAVAQWRQWRSGGSGAQWRQWRSRRSRRAATEASVPKACHGGSGAVAAVAQ